MPNINYFWRVRNIICVYLLPKYVFTINEKLIFSLDKSNQLISTQPSQLGIIYDNRVLYSISVPLWTIIHELWLIETHPFLVDSSYNKLGSIMYLFVVSHFMKIQFIFIFVWFPFKNNFLNHYFNIKEQNPIYFHSN